MSSNLVYKYRGGDESSFKRDLKSLEENSYYAAPVEKLNDPCEALINTDIFNLQSSLFSKFIKTSSKEALENVKDALANLIKRKNKVGIYSLSKTFKDELLWAHYANSHYGFCIEYDLDLLVNHTISDKTYSSDVKYSSSPPQIGLRDIAKAGTNHLGLIQKMVCRKSRRWSYEEEYRLIKDRFGLHSYNYQAVKSVYFGLRMKTEDQSAIMNSLKGRGVQYFKIKQIEKSYKFDSIPIADIHGSEITYLKQIPSSITGQKDIKFNITKTEYSSVYKKASIEITLESKIDNQSLNWLSSIIRNHIFKNAKLIFMFYYFQEQSNKEVCWATTHLKDNEITISINDFIE